MASYTLPTGKVGERLNILLKTLSEGHPRRISFTARAGRRYARIMSERSVHAFIENETGHVYKAASFAQPAKGIRYDLSDNHSFSRLLREAEWTGGYLYNR